MRALCKPQSHSHPTGSAFEGGASGPDPGSCRSRAGSGGVVASGEMSPEIPALVRGMSVCGFVYVINVFLCMSCTCIHTCDIYTHTHTYMHIISLFEKYFGDSVGRVYSSVLWISVFSYKMVKTIIPLYQIKLCMEVLGGSWCQLVG